MPKIANLKPKTTFPFLSLPLEVRRKVYFFMREWPSQHHHAVLRASKQIYAESKESFDQRALICSSQQEFVKKVSNALSVVLNKIESLAINFEYPAFSYDQRPLEVLAADESLCAVGEKYFKDLRSVIICLRRLPNIMDLSVLRPRKDNHDEPAEDYLKSLLTWLSKNYTQVESLTVTLRCVNFDAFSTFSNLHTLRCMAYSLTSEEQMITVLETMIRLKDLTLMRPRPEFRGKDLLHSFTPKALRSMTPLKTLRLLEEDDSEGEYGDRRDWLHPPLITPAVFAAFSERHCDTIQHLTIDCDDSFDSVVFPQQMELFVTKATSLKTLALNLRHSEIDFLEHLPQSLQSLKLSLSATTLPSCGQTSLIELHSKLPHLRKISYNVYNERTGRTMFTFESDNYGRTRYVYYPGRYSE